jgi:Holliday junction DNA helicase RuvB
VRDYVTSKADGKIDLQRTDLALDMAGIDTLGLDRQDRKYLETLIRVFGGGPAGVEAIAHTMNTATDTLADEVEPFLLRGGLVIRTPRGRTATTLAYQHLKITPANTEANASRGQRSLFDT